MKSQLKHMGDTVFLCGDSHSFYVGPSFLTWFTDASEPRDGGPEKETHEVRFDLWQVSVCSGYF